MIDEKFLKSYLGVELTLSQKALLRLMNMKQYIIPTHRHFGKLRIQDLQIEYAKAMDIDFCIATPKGLEFYKNGKFDRFEKHKGCE